LSKATDDEKMIEITSPNLIIDCLRHQTSDEVRLVIPTQLWRMPSAAEQ
jgi:hypothetical protein